MFLRTFERRRPPTYSFYKKNKNVKPNICMFIIKIFSS
jgi:hypothetical protein